MIVLPIPGTGFQFIMAEGDVNVVPVNDLVEHEPNEDCVCGPTMEPVKRDDGLLGWVIVHHSLDGREAHE